MHNFEQVGDVLEHLQNLHQKVAKFYADTAKDVADEKASLLLNTLVNHEENMHHEISDYRSDASRTVLDTYFQYVDDVSSDGLFKFDKPAAELKAEDVYDTSMLVDNYLGDFFDKMIERSEIVEVRELFENLREEVEEEKKRLSMDVTGLLDM